MDSRNDVLLPILEQFILLHRGWLIFNAPYVLGILQIVVFMGFSFFLQLEGVLLCRNLNNELL